MTDAIAQRHKSVKDGIARDIAAAIERTRLTGILHAGRSEAATAARVAAALLRERNVPLFARGGRVAVVIDGDPPEVRAAMWATIANIVHSNFVVVSTNAKGTQSPTTICRDACEMLIDAAGELLPPIEGISSLPVMNDAGELSSRDGYDPGVRLWFANVPTLHVPAHPTADDAHAALVKLRAALRHFAFADTERVRVDGVDEIDQKRPPALDESTALAALLTAVVRPSLRLAPGFAFTAAQLSGAGTGKGTLAAAIGIIAHGRRPRPFAGGHDGAELCKRLDAALLAGEPVLFLDNLNNTILSNDTLAMAISEGDALIRPFGFSNQIKVAARQLVLLTGNGLLLGEDLVRRFLTVRFDAGEAPEHRKFPLSDEQFHDNLLRRRGELLSAAFTIIRWGRRNRLPEGQRLASFGTWARWVRDPLLALGCLDPVARISEAKLADPKRERTADLLMVWHDHHGTQPVRVAELADAVAAIIDPQNRGRQFRASVVAKLVGTRLAGMILTRHPSSDKTGSRYAVVSTEAPDPAPNGHAADAWAEIKRAEAEISGWTQ